MTSTPEELLQSTNLAVQALQEITELETIGAFAGHEPHEDTVATLFFECLLPAYPGWKWAATLAKVGDDEPVTVLETELLPGEGALLAPEWVPWAERLAAYRKAQTKQAEEEAALAAAAAEEVGDDSDDEDDLMDNDFSDFDTDLDGVDIDALADSDEDTDDEGDEEENEENED